MATAVATVLSIPEKLDFRVKKATEAGTGYKLPKSYNASYVNHMNKRLATGAYKLVGTKLFFVKKEDRVALETSEAPVQTAGKVGRPRKAKKVAGRRGRPAGSKNKPKDVAPVAEATPAPAVTSEPSPAPAVEAAPATGEVAQS